MSVAVPCAITQKDGEDLTAVAYDATQDLDVGILFGRNGEQNRTPFNLKEFGRAVLEATAIVPRAFVLLEKPIVFYRTDFLFGAGTEVADFHGARVLEARVGHLRMKIRTGSRRRSSNLSLRGCATQGRTPTRGPALLMQSLTIDHHTGSTDSQHHRPGDTIRSWSRAHPGVSAQGWSTRASNLFLWN